MFNKKEILTKSNLISFLRFFLVIPLWLLLDDLQNPASRYYAFALCIFAAFTDILDGYLARKNNEVTEFGKIIDPLADKVAVAVVITKLYMEGEIPAYYFIMILVRDLLIFFGGIYVSQKLGRVLPSNVLGKITVIVIGIVILFILLNINRDGIIFMAFYSASILLIFASLIGYAIRAAEFLKQKNYGSV